MTPLSEGRAALLAAFMGEGLNGTVLDLGCGWAELLLRVVADQPAAYGVGVDTDERSIAHGRLLAERRGIDNRVRLDVGDAKLLAPEHADAVVCIGASQIGGRPSRTRSRWTTPAPWTPFEARSPRERGCCTARGSGRVRRPHKPWRRWATDWTRWCPWPNCSRSSPPTASSHSSSTKPPSTSGTSSSRGTAPATHTGSSSTEWTTRRPRRSSSAPPVRGGVPRRVPRHDGQAYLDYGRLISGRVLVTSTPHCDPVSKRAQPRRGAAGTAASDRAA